MRIRWLKTFSSPVKCPGPLRNRDFVNQRSWRFFGGEYIVFNHSIPYKVGLREVDWGALGWTGRQGGGCMNTEEEGQ